MNLLFLDVDGVLNCEDFYEKQYNCSRKEFSKTNKKDVKKKIITGLEYYKNNICSDRIKMLNVVCEKHNIKVIISASMRNNNSVENLQKIFKYCGATFEIIDKTECFGFERGVEISWWLKNKLENYTNITYENFKNYVILDDENDFLIRQKDNFFQTDSYFGLTEECCNLIDEFFKNNKIDEITD
jgi:hypothetical protein